MLGNKQFKQRLNKILKKNVSEIQIEKWLVYKTEAENNKQFKRNMIADTYNNYKKKRDDNEINVIIKKMKHIKILGKRKRNKNFI